MNDDEVASLRDVLKKLGGFGDDGLDLADVIIFAAEAGATVVFAYGLRRATSWMRMGLSALLRG